MGEAAFLAAFLILLAATLFDWIAERLIEKPDGVSCATVVLAGGGREDIEQVLRWAHFRMQKDCAGCGEAYVLFTQEAGEREKKAAEAFCRGHSGVHITDAENLREILGDTVYKTVRFVIY